MARLIQSTFPPRLAGLDRCDRGFVHVPQHVQLVPIRSRNGVGDDIASDPKHPGPHLLAESVCDFDVESRIGEEAVPEVLQLDRVDVVDRELRPPRSVTRTPYARSARSNVPRA
jgi:hypothetical protein